MKLTCTQENFKKAIYNCERVVYKKNTLPILNNILFETEKGGLKLSATNLEIGVSVKIGAKIEKEGKITLPAKLISNFSASLPGGDNVVIETMEDKLKIKSGLIRAVIKGMPANDFPLIPSKNTEYLLELSSGDIKEILSKILPAVAINEARQELTGINLILTAEELFFAATDSFRLAEYRWKINKNNIKTVDYETFIEKKNNFIIPSGAMIELNRIISVGSESKVKIAIEEGQIFFETGNTKIVSRLINGKYPEYKHIMPKEYKTRIVGEKLLLQNASKMASLFSLGSSGEITLKIDSNAGKFIIQSSGAETGENSTELKFDISGPSQEIVFNSRYLLDGINIVSSNQLALLANSSLTPVAIKEIDEKTGQILDNFVYIVMPVRS